MIARAGVVVERLGDRNRCTELRSEPPLTLRETTTGVHLVASGAGPVGGDDLGLTIRVGPGAHLDLRSVAASMVHPGPTGRSSHLVVDVDVAGGSLRWAPEPTILVRGCDHHATARIRLGAAAALVWREELVLGRHDEVAGSVLQRLLVDGAAGAVLRTDLALGPRWPGSLGPGGVGDARAVGTVVLVGGEAARWGGALPEVPGVRWASSPLRDPDPSLAPAVLITAVAATPIALAAALDLVTQASDQRSSTGAGGAAISSGDGRS